MMLAVLPVLLLPYPLGYAVGRSVRDEIVPAQPYLTICSDGLLFVMTSMLILMNDWHALLVPTLLLLLLFRRLTAFRQGYAPLSGLLTGISLVQHLLPIVLVGIVLTYLAGLQEKRLDPWWLAQPACGLLVVILA